MYVYVSKLLHCYWISVSFGQTEAKVINNVRQNGHHMGLHSAHRGLICLTDWLIDLLTDWWICWLALKVKTPNEGKSSRMFNPCLSAYIAIRHWVSLVTVKCLTCLIEVVYNDVMLGFVYKMSWWNFIEYKRCTALKLCERLWR